MSNKNIVLTRELSSKLADVIKTAAWMGGSPAEIWQAILDYNDGFDQESLHLLVS